MQLEIEIGAERFSLEIDTGRLEEAEPFFQKMDEDMSQGWQMSRVWVEKPDQRQRCQIAADRLLAAYQSGNRELLAMMAGYIVRRMPEVSRVVINTDGEMMETRLESAGTAQ